ncbi:DUF4265 domain-containing protein [Acinetobacter chinensis]|uniref:DUF4265 domain-containing protein n=1 Tax=Acinetobacter chinensis TaxID=2004650 RepID=A0ABU3WDA2_9GAMM|nr:DUF4265 domain-containing protein [Acinetobacter chinensis]MDV2468373.1 DUF4265 domain-containing protein [Acinetobacter chinensis]
MIYHKVGVNYINLDNEDDYEWLVCVKNDQNSYKVKSLPFFINHFALDDIITININDISGVYICEERIQSSGSSIIRIIFYNLTTDFIDSVINYLASLGCTCGSMAKHFYSINIPENVDYQALEKYMKSFDISNLEYSEGCISDKHWLDLERI